MEINGLPIRLRHATLSDIDLLAHWDEQQHNIDSDPTDDWNWAEELPRQVPWREQLVAELDGRPIGFVQIIDPYEEETHYWGIVARNLRAVDIWIGEQEDLGKGYGTIMMRLALDRCFQTPEVTAVIIDPLGSNVRAHRFYERIGFEFIEERLFGADRCRVYKFERRRWKSSK